MKAVILVDDGGSELVKRQNFRLNSMIEIGRKPIIRHMEIFSSYGMYIFIIIASIPRM